MLPDRIELSTSPFITLMLSHPPRGVCVLDHPFTIGPEGPLGAARLASTPSQEELGLARDCRQKFLDGFPEFERFVSDHF